MERVGAQRVAEPSHEDNHGDAQSDARLANDAYQLFEAILLQIIFELVVVEEDFIEFPYGLEVAAVLKGVGMGLFEGRSLCVESLT